MNDHNPAHQGPEATMTLKTSLPWTRLPGLWARHELVDFLAGPSRGDWHAVPIGSLWELWGRPHEPHGGVVDLPKAAVAP